MHPNPLFRSEDRAKMATLVERIGFGTVFAQTAIGPRVVHTPLVMAGEDRVRFHISRANALAGHLEGATALIVANGPDGYISPRWYANRDTVPTWDYVALEFEGLVSVLISGPGFRVLQIPVGPQLQAVVRLIIKHESLQPPYSLWIE